MDNLNYEQIMNIQENATRKLLNYIDNFFQIEKNTKSIEFYYPDFDERRTRMAFNVWISLDYKTKYGKNFIELFLEESPEELTKQEQEILFERNKSFISLFEIKNIKGDLMYVKDVFNNRYHIVWEPELSKIVDKSELIFGRIAKVLVYEKFVGDISFLPEFAKDIFVEKIYLDFNSVKKTESNISMEKYLRKYSLHFYKAYTDCIYDILGFEDEESIKLSEELGEFEEYLKKHFTENTIKRHMTNLIDIYDFYLYDKNFTLYDLDKINLDYFLKEGIYEGFIGSQTQLNSYITTLKKYLKFLIDSKKEGVYKKAYENILEISKNRYEYFKPKAPINIPLNWDRQLDDPIKENLNKKSVNFLKNFEIFLSYIKNNKVEVTSTNKFIKSKYLGELNNLITHKFIFQLFNNIKQPDLPLIHLFYKFSLCYNILTIEKDTIVPHTKIEEYMNLKSYEKLALFIDYIWNTLSWNELSTSYHDNSEQNYRFEIIENLSQLKIDTIYEYDKVKYKEIDTPIFDKYIIEFFDHIGLIEYEKYSIFEKESSNTIYSTSLGKNVFNILKEDKYKNTHSMGKIIHLKDWKKNR